MNLNFLISTLIIDFDFLFFARRTGLGNTNKYTAWIRSSWIIMSTNLNNLYRKTSGVPKLLSNWTTSILEAKPIFWLRRKLMWLLKWAAMFGAVYGAVYLVFYIRFATLAYAPAVPSLLRGYFEVSKNWISGVVNFGLGRVTAGWSAFRVLFMTPSNGR